MNTRIIQVAVEKEPKSYSWCDDFVELDEEYDLKYVYALNLDRAWYWYAQGSYEGDGAMLMLKGGKWATENLSHCSCYGPTEGISFSAPIDSLEELEKSGTEEWLKEFAPLIKAAREEGYE